MSIIDKLLQITSGCRDDMHEPDEQGVTAHVVGYTLDNAMGDDLHIKAIEEGWQEIVVLITKDQNTTVTLNLASLIALARIGAETDKAKRIFE